MLLKIKIELRKEGWKKVASEGKMDQYVLISYNWIMLALCVDMNF